MKISPSCIEINSQIEESWWGSPGVDLTYLRDMPAMSTSANAQSGGFEDLEVAPAAAMFRSHSAPA